MEYLFDLGKDVLITVSMSSTRMIGAITSLSFLGAGILGGALVRNCVAISLSLIVYPLVSEQIAAAELTTPLIIGITMKELFIGMLIGYSVAVGFWAIQSVGYFIDNQRGATVASSFNPLIGEQSSPLGVFMTQTLIAVFFVSGIFVLFIEGIYASYEIWPVTTFFPSLNFKLIEYIIQEFVLIIALAVLLAGPIIIAMFLAEFGLGLIGRFAPQLNIFFLSMPVKSGVSSFLLVFYWSVLILYFGDLIDNVHENIDRLSKVMQ